MKDLKYFNFSLKAVAIESELEAGFSGQEIDLILGEKAHSFQFHQGSIQKIGQSIASAFHDLGFEFAGRVDIRDGEALIASQGFNLSFTEAGAAEARVPMGSSVLKFEFERQFENFFTTQKAYTKTYESRVPTLRGIGGDKNRLAQFEFYFSVDLIDVWVLPGPDDKPVIGNPGTGVLVGGNTIGGTITRPIGTGLTAHFDRVMKQQLGSRGFEIVDVRLGTGWDPGGL